jgi:SAM-dependent methyltransferase
LEHLASLHIPVAGKTVLEVGAGIGDHSSYYLDRGCRLTITEGRADNLKYLRNRYPGVRVEELNMDAPRDIDGGPFDVVHCYGLLYHLKEPMTALKFLSQQCSGMLLLETCVSFGESLAINPVDEPKHSPTQAISGVGCRPTRTWIFDILKQDFPYVYIPKTQPNHEEFPIDWTDAGLHKTSYSRAVFIASRSKLDNQILLEEVPGAQIRHD